MRVLLDTHVLLWALSSPRKIPSATLAVLRDSKHSVFVSAASLWEIAIKSTLGKLTAQVEAIAREIDHIGFMELGIHIRHGVRLSGLPPHHRDPFDRILVAQALEEGLTLVTADAAFARYAVPMLWAA